MKKKIMILGAGIYQVPLIRKAIEYGLSPVVVSIPGDYPGFALADTCCYLDTRDFEQVLEAARRERIAGICTSGTDVAVRTIGYVCEALNLPGLSRAAACTVTDKYLMKTAFASHQVRTAPFQKAASLEDALAAAKAIGYPVMIKAVDSSGNRGISRADFPSQAAGAYESARKVTRRPYVLVEKYLSGIEIGVDGFIENGKIRLLFPHEKFVLQRKNATVTAGHAFPYHAGKEVLEDLTLQIHKAVIAAGLDHCAFNADVLVLDNQAWVLEIGGRAGATCIPELISQYCGFDYYRKILDCAVGKPINFLTSSPIPCMARLLFSPVDGVLTAIDAPYLTHLKNQGILAQLDYPVGAAVRGVQNGTDRLGQLIMQTEDSKVLEQAHTELCRHIKVNGKTLEELWEN